MQVLPSGQLRIMHASPEDAGKYFCIAQNSVGSAMAKTRLVVQGGPRGVIAQDSEALSSLSTPVLTDTTLPFPPSTASSWDASMAFLFSL